MLLELCVAVLAVLLVVAYNIWLVGESPRFRYNSFAPARNNSQAKWFVDGKDYMSAVADAIESAKDEIMITDWQLNSEIFMKRPDSGVDSLKWRLDKMLLKKATDGVRIYILLYWETKPFMDLGSNHAKNLLGKHKNIEVLRHPDTISGISSPTTLFRWSHHEKMVIIDRSIAFVGGIDLCFGRWDTRSHELMDDYPTHPNIKEENKNEPGEKNIDAVHSRWIGKDYRNTFLNKESETDWEKPFVDYKGFNRSEIPRMPWHDIACAFTGDAVMDAVTHFIQRYNALKPWWWKVWQAVRQRFMYPKQRTEQIFLNSGVHNVSVQVLRSVDNWSAAQEHEQSIYDAYIHAIENAKHFIYIENQFFISSQEGFWRKVQNKIQSALVDRIVRAHEASEDFHVMVITPLKPEFPGEWDSEDWNGDFLRAVTFWNQATIYHGPDSLFNKLKKHNIPKESAEKYFSVYSLRTHGLLNGFFMTEIVYVHSKVMVVDDRLAIIGSANINDRSMLGERDSEVAVIIEDLEMVDSKMNGRPYQVGKFSHSLRCDLLKEHLGLLGKDEHVSEIDVEDPLAGSFLKGVAARAEMNTVIYVTMFGPAIFPREGVEDFEELKKWKEYPMPRVEKDSFREVLDNVKGNLVLYPCSFLVKELKPSLLDFGYMFVNRKKTPSESQILYA